MSCPRWFPNFIRQITEQGERYAGLELLNAKENSSAAVIEEKKKESAWIKEKMQELRLFLEKMVPEPPPVRRIPASELAKQAWGEDQLDSCSSD